MELPLKNKIAIVTGGSQGYGMGIAKVLKSSGCKVWIIARNKSNLKKTAKKLKLNYIQADISKSEDWDKIFDTVIKKDKKIDILVNNAGAAIKMVNLEKFSDKDIEKSIAVNLTSHILGSNRAVKYMKKQKSGTIFNISSVCAESAWPTLAVYSAAKAGVVQFSKCLHTEVKDMGIRVIAVIPSWGATNFLKAAGLKNHDSNKPKIRKKIMQPEEMGDLIVSLYKLPKHLTVPYIRVQPMIQDIIPM